MKAVKVPLFLVITVVVTIVAIGAAAYQLRTPVDAPAGTQQPVAGEKVTRTGVLVCLPPKNPDGPTTMECAYGLKTPEGTHYALGGLDQTALDTPMNTAVTVEGTLKPAGAGERYDIVGTITVTSFSAN